MKKLLIGCGVLLALGVVAVIALIAFAPFMFRMAVDGQLVGSIAFQQIQVQPESPSAEDMVSLKVGVTFGGTGGTPAGGVQLQVAAEKKGEQEKRTATAALSRTAGAGPSGVSQGTATIELGKLPEGRHTFIVAIQQPAQGSVVAIERPREVQVLVKVEFRRVERLKLDDAALYQDLGLDVARFEIKAPRDTKVMVWLETHKHGKLVEELSWGEYQIPQPGKGVQTRFRWTQFRPPTSSPPETTKVKWVVGFDGSSLHKWIDDPFAPYRSHAESGEEKTWEVEPGKTYLLWHRAASESGGVQFGSEDQLKKNDLVIMLKCRIEAADPNRQGASGGGITEVPP